MNARRSALRIVLIGIVIGVVGTVLLGVYIVAYGQADRAVRSDVIVVLGAGTRDDGTPNRAQTRRTRHAIALYQRGFAPYLLCTGGYTNNHPRTEAQTCVDLALQLGVPAEAILREDVSTTTLENAAEAQKVMTTKGLMSAIIVTDDFHLFRSEWLFHAYGVSVTLSPAQATQGPLSPINTFTATLREIGSLVLNFYRLAVAPPVITAT